MAKDTLTFKMTLIANGVSHNLTGAKLADVAQKMNRWTQKNLTA